MHGQGGCGLGRWTPTPMERFAMTQSHRLHLFGDCTRRCYLFRMRISHMCCMDIHDQPEVGPGHPDPSAAQAGAGPAGHPHVSACDGLLAHLASSWNYAMSCARCGARASKYGGTSFTVFILLILPWGDLGCLAAAMDAVRPRLLVSCVVVATCVACLRA